MRIRFSVHTRVSTTFTNNASVMPPGPVLVAGPAFLEAVGFADTEPSWELRRGGQTPTAFSLPQLQHPRQIWAPRTAWVIHVTSNLLRAGGCEFIKPIDELGIAATVLDEAMQSKRAVAPTFLASNAHKIGLADQISEDDGTVAGHNLSPNQADRTMRLRGRAAKPCDHPTPANA
jgi:hypothetical protein